VSSRHFRGGTSSKLCPGDGTTPALLMPQKRVRDPGAQARPAERMPTWRAHLRLLGHEGVYIYATLVIDELLICVTSGEELAPCLLRRHERTRGAAGAASVAAAAAVRARGSRAFPM
jgi:hypothetical protein